MNKLTVGSEADEAATAASTRRVGNTLRARHTRVSGVSQPSRTRRVQVAAAANCSIQFIKGVEEPTVPDVKLTRSRDGGQGTAIFYFEKPAVFENSGEAGEITGLYMIDDEGEMSTVRILLICSGVVGPIHPSLHETLFPDLSVVLHLLVTSSCVRYTDTDNQSDF